MWAGSTITGQSTSEIDTSDFDTTGAGGFKQIGISKDPENSDTAGSANCNAYVVFNETEHVFTT